jgi:hypothetical protein
MYLSVRAIIYLYCLNYVFRASSLRVLVPFYFLSIQTVNMKLWIKNYASTAWSRKNVILFLRSVVQTVKVRDNYLCTYDLYSPVLIMFWMRAYPLQGQVGGGWAVEISSFLGPKWHSPIGSWPLRNQYARIQNMTHCAVSVIGP